ncbi:MAG: hypothetical protein ACREPI_10770 [Candidatus Dormibacterales bacterium]
MEPPDPLILAHPATVFRDLLQETLGHLDSTGYVVEWLPPRRLPVFDVQPLRDYGAVEANRERLVALLASFVRIASGSVWERSGGRWRRRRYSELNPVDLAELGAMSRLGDLALFMSGVFPEHVASHPPTPTELARLGRLLGREPGELARSGKPFWVMEWVGRSAYERAGHEPLARDFRTARRLLNVLTGRHLFAIRRQWLAGSSWA